MRALIGDDEHGWSERGTFNFEGGCHAKTICLNREAEPEIYATTEMFGTGIENMVHDPDTLVLDFDDDSLTPNMRCAYPLDCTSNASLAAAGYRKDPNFGFEVPVSVKGVPDILLDPRGTWELSADYDRHAAKPVEMFADNLATYEAHIDDDVKAIAIG